MSRKMDIYISIFLLVFCSIAFFQIRQLPKGATTEFGLGFFPTIMTIVLAILSIVLFTKGLINKQLNDNEQEEKLQKSSLTRVLAMVLLMVSYVVFYEILGFIISTIIFVFITMLLLNEKKKLVLVSVPLTITTVIYLGFTKILNVVLP